MGEAQLDEDIVQRRRDAAAKAVVTRQERHEKEVHDVAKRIVGGWQVGNRKTCVICKKDLSDPPSIARGVGPECFDHLMDRIDWVRRRQGILPTAAEDAAVLWFWDEATQKWVDAPVLRTTAAHVLILVDRRMGTLAGDGDVYAVDRHALDAQGWAFYRAKWKRDARFYTEAGKAAFAAKRAGAIAYPLLEMPADMPSEVIYAAARRATDALCRAVPFEQRRNDDFRARWAAIDKECAAAVHQTRTVPEAA